MEQESIRIDEITPAYMNAYKKWWRDFVEPYIEGAREEAREGERTTPVRYNRENPESRIHIAKMNIVMRQMHAEFGKKYPWYRVEFPDFWSACVRHPLGWKILRIPNEEEHYVNCFEEIFEEIRAYDIKMNDNL